MPPASIPSLPADLVLLAHHCRDAVHGRTARRSAPEGLLERLARRHRVEGLYAASVNDRHGIESAMAASLAQRAEIARLSVHLKDLDAIFLKGQTVAAGRYANDLLKHSADIDILVGPQRAAAAAAALQSAGYACVVPRSAARLDVWYRFSNQSVWRNGPHVVELHVRPLAIDYTPTHPPRPIDLSPGLRIIALDDADLYPYLVNHGALSGWFRLKWLVDLYAVVAHSNLTPSELHAAASHAGARRASAQALILANMLFDVDLPPHVAAEPGASDLVRLALRLLQSDEPTRSFFGTWPIHKSAFLLDPDMPPVARRVRNLIAQRILA